MVVRPVQFNLSRAGRPVIAGILNVTPDSFSDAGRFIDPRKAIEQAERMIGEGADMLDIGGESTRPGAQRIDAAQQMWRVLPVIRALAEQGVAMSIDTTLAEVAEAAIEAGAGMINDVSAGREDACIFTLAARTGVPIILMHMKGEPATMQVNPTYDDVVTEVLAFLRERAEAAIAAGLNREQIILDPGIGFGKTIEHNLKLLGALDQFVATGFPIMLGVSRKRFLGELTGAKEPADRAVATAATTAIGVMAGVQMFRVHDVAENRHAADVTFAVKRQQMRSPET